MKNQGFLQRGSCVVGNGDLISDQICAILAHCSRLGGQLSAVTECHLVRKGINACSRHAGAETPVVCTIVATLAQRPALWRVHRPKATVWSTVIPSLDTRPVHRTVQSRPQRQRLRLEFLSRRSSAIHHGTIAAHRGVRDQFFLQRIPSRRNRYSALGGFSDGNLIRRPS